MRFVIDIQIERFLGHAGYPVMATENWCDTLLNLDDIRKNGCWGAVHELGHLHQSPTWTYQGQEEVTVNWFSLHAYETMLGWKTKIHDDDSTTKVDVLRRSTHQKAMKRIFSNDPTKPGKWESGSDFEKLVMWVQLVDAFGWDSFKDVIKSYPIAPHASWPKTETDRGGEFMVRLSKRVGKNLYPFFFQWGVEMPRNAAKRVSHLPPWMPKNP